MRRNVSPPTRCVIFKALNLEIPLITAKSEYNEESKRIDVELINFNDSKYRDFKEEIVDNHLSLGKHVIYFGDGSSDKYGSELANTRFVVRNSSLEQLCKQKEMSYIAFDDFKEVLDKIQQLLQ